MSRPAPGLALPDFPWDVLAEYADRARAYPGGMVDLSVGTPVDPVSPGIVEAARRVADEPGYPTTHGTAVLREAAVEALCRRYGVTGLHPDAVLPTIGSKELVAWLPTLLGLGSGSVVAIPELSYPTYEVGALLAGATVVRTDEPDTLAVPPAMVWLNSPSNPTGRVLTARRLRELVDWARGRGVLLVSDECYLSLWWEQEPVSVLHPDVCDGGHEGLLAVHSLSKSSNLAGYRAGYVTGDAEVVARLLAIRKHAGMLVPRTVQAAMTAALGDDEHVAVQRERYRGRRELLRAGLLDAGFTVDHSQAGLYLWACRGGDAWDSVAALAELGILVAPGTFYGPAGAGHVRVALTVSDQGAAQAGERLRSVRGE